MGDARNPLGTVYEVRETVLASEAAAVRQALPSAGRHWKVANPGRLNHVGKPVAYALVPGGHSTQPFAHAASVIGRRAGFMYAPLWVTPEAFAQGERYPAGDFPFQQGGSEGLPAWTAADRPLVARDLVLWHSFGTNHVPRVEDWPVMAVETTGFKLKPSGFFRRNPAIDVAPPVPACREPGGQQNLEKDVGKCCGHAGS